MIALDTSASLIGEARRLLDEAAPGTASVWSRAAALLARQALEDALRRLFAAKAPGVEHLNLRAQLLCLPTYLAAGDLPRDVTYAWNALSRATHHHPYELDPTRDELSSLLAVTERLVAAVAEATAS